MEASPASAPVALESSVLRYYTSQLMLRVLPSDDYDPDGASFAAFGSTDASPFVSIYDAPPTPSSALLLQRTPSVVVLPPTRQGKAESKDARITRGVFTVLPAEGFAKEPGQPVYYNDPIELMDQHGRLLGIVGRAPHAGHLAADGHSGALVFVLERHTSRLQNIGKRFFRQEMRSLSNISHTSSGSGSETGSTHSSSAQSNPVAEETMRKSWGLTRKQSMVAVCGGERLRIPGLTRASKRAFPGDSIMQHHSLSETNSSSGDRKSLAARDDEPPYLTCEIVLTSQPGAAAAPPSEVKAPSSSSQKKKKAQVADRTATGEYVGVLHSGILHRRSDHMKIWKKRFFVLTQVALHRFDAHETLESIKTQKTRGAIFLKDCRGIRYERFARPHELEILLNNGKVFSLHAVDALTCAQWASVLSQAIENPQWVHAERGYLTVWRSDAQFESPQCPKVTKVALKRGVSKLQDCTKCDLSVHKKSVTMVSTDPAWSEKLSLGSITASGFVMVQLADGNMFRITLEDLTKSIVRPHWIAVATSLEVAKIHSLGEDGDMPDTLSDELPLRRSELVIDDKSRFLVRLKFQADLQLDRRLTQRRSFETEKRLLGGIVAVLLVLPAVLYGQQHALDPRARSFCLVSTVLAGLVVVVLGPVAWQMYLWLRYNKTMEGELHWFITLLALEVRPHGDEISDRFSTSSGEDSNSNARSRVESFIDDDEMSEHNALVMPTRPSFLGEDLSSLHDLPSPGVSAQAIRTFRLENALDSILGRPQLSFFAIKKHFPTRFLPRDESGRRVLLVELNKVNRKGLKAHNLSGFNVVRYFLYLWEFIWSYQDLHEGATDSKLVLIVDCSGWKYFKWFGIECQILMNMLEMTNRYYPGRLAKILFVRDYATYGLYGQLVGKCLDPALRALFDRQAEMPPYLKATIDSAKPSRDETLLSDFVVNVLATAANVTIPNFTRRELEQAARFAKTGSLDSDESGDPASGDTIGTRAVLLPDGWEALEWHTVLEDGSLTIWRLQDPKAKNESVKGASFQSDAQISQWRGRMKLKSTNADVVTQYLNDPKLAMQWRGPEDNIILLDKLSRQEDISFWSRRVPFMSFSLSGHRGHDGQRSPELETNAVFECVTRRIYEAKKGKRPQDRVCTTMWKTTSAQSMVVNRPPLTDEQQSNGTVQWRKLEDPFVSLCFVVEETTTFPGKKELTLSFWFQSFAPTATTSQSVQIAKLIADKTRRLDECVAQLPEKK